MCVAEWAPVVLEGVERGWSWLWRQVECMAEICLGCEVVGRGPAAESLWGSREWAASP